MAGPLPPPPLLMARQLKEEFFFCGFPRLKPKGTFLNTDFQPSTGVFIKTQFFIHRYIYIYNFHDIDTINVTG